MCDGRRRHTQFLRVLELGSARQSLPLALDVRECAAARHIFACASFASAHVALVGFVTEVSIVDKL